MFYSTTQLILFAERVVFIILLSVLLYLAYKFVGIGLNTIFAHRRHEKHIDILISVTKSTFLYLAFFIIIVTILQQMGIDLTAILASAGILGLAVSFGAQSLVKDVISGIFIILENQFTIGEEVLIVNSGKDAKGKVESINLRTTILKDNAGVLYIIPNGGITHVANYSRTKK
ncbi:MAG: mechanosensitive ion channel [Candidatus Saganbacteria bacterium]|nr:mechanosensitive ion channel [Candidatus Saganbacteria bacterium]